MQCLEWLCNWWLLFLFPITSNWYYSKSHVTLSHSVWIPSWPFYSFPTLTWSSVSILNPTRQVSFSKYTRARVSPARTALLLHLRKLVFTPSMWCVIVSVIPPSTTTSCQVSVGQKPDTHLYFFILFLFSVSDGACLTDGWSEADEKVSWCKHACHITLWDLNLSPSLIFVHTGVSWKLFACNGSMSSGLHYKFRPRPVLVLVFGFWIKQLQWLAIIYSL